jgi:hypothetical protein
MNIYVGNLSRDLNEGELREAFAAFGDVASAAIIKDKFSGETRGFGFVEMPNKDEADKAIAVLNGKDLKGKVIAFLTEYAVVDRIIRHLGLTFAAEKPPPAQVFEQVALMATLMEAMRTARLPLRPVLMETCLRLHECGRGERGL